MDIYCFIGLLIIFAFGIGILQHENMLRARKFCIPAVVLLFLAMAVRALCLSYETLDYQNFLTHWVSYFAENGGWSALSGDVGNYNIPYLYFLAAFSYSGVKDLYLIKLLSIFFDILLAWGILRLVRIYTDSAVKRMCAFFITLFLPTVILNGALWGQCDSIYSAFAVWSIYFALDGKPVRSVISVALSFAFKLQAIFVIPIFLLFIYTRRLKWWHPLIFPLTYVVTILPAVIEGRPFMDTLLLYFNQANTVGDGLNYNSPSIFSFFNNVSNTETASKLGIIAAFVFLAVILGCLFVFRNHVSDKCALAAALLTIIGIPFFLPHMHDRYFFIADVLSLGFAIVASSYAAVPVLVSFASLLGYHAYLRMRYLFPMSYGAVALIIAMLILAFYICRSVYCSAKNSEKRC